MKVAVLGTGFGAYHAELYAKIADVEKIIVWGRNREKLQELQDKLSVDTTDDMEEIWNNHEIDLIDICLPNHLHKETAVKALRAGKHVLIETPVAECLEDAEEIFKAAEECGKRVFVDLFLRFEYAYEYLFQLAKEKQYGRLREIQVKRETPPWWGNLDSKHIGLNLMMHDIDFVVRLMGDAEHITANSIDIREQQSIVTARLKYKDAYALVRGASSMPDTYPFSVGYEAVFEHAVVRYYEDGYSDGQTKTKLELFCNDKKTDIPLQQADCYEAVLRNVLQCIKENQASCLDIKEAILTLKNVLNMNQELKK